MTQSRISRAQQHPSWRGLSTLSVVGFSSFLTSCRGVQSALDPAGPQSSRLAALSWSMFAMGAIVLTVTIFFLLYAITRSRNGHPERLSQRQGWTLVLSGGVIVPLIVLFGILVYSIAIDRQLTNDADPVSLEIEVVGHQWWWRVSYLDQNGHKIAETANELHLPVGRATEIHLKSTDVIHSFWVPNLQGKKDLVPGRTNTIRLRADRPGIYRGQCAEFCGIQHAKMSLIVVVSQPAEFESWLFRQGQPAREPGDPLTERGQEVFVTSSCVLCHTIRGTVAFGRVAPDLTHLASRLSLAAASVPNTRGFLAGWILDPQNIKPGNHMPPTNLAPEELHALLSYLESLD